jgi:hypothetical protein
MGSHLLGRVPRARRRRREVHVAARRARQVVQQPAGPAGLGQETGVAEARLADGTELEAVCVVGSELRAGGRAGGRVGGSGRSVGWAGQHCQSPASCCLADRLADCHSPTGRPSDRLTCFAGSGQVALLYPKSWNDAFPPGRFFHVSGSSVNQLKGRMCERVAHCATRGGRTR